MSAQPGGGFVREALTNGNGVAKRLIVALVLFSAVITGLITAIELWLDYRRDLAQIERSLQFIENSYLPTLTDSVTGLPPAVNGIAFTALRRRSAAVRAPSRQVCGVITRNSPPPVRATRSISRAV